MSSYLVLSLLSHYHLSKSYAFFFHYLENRDDISMVWVYVLVNLFRVEIKLDLLKRHSFPSCLCRHLVSMPLSQLLTNIGFFVTELYMEYSTNRRTKTPLSFQFTEYIYRLCICLDLMVRMSL